MDAKPIREVTVACPNPSPSRRYSKGQVSSAQPHISAASGAEKPCTLDKLQHEVG
jgi:hypothetical protein